MLLFPIIWVQTAFVLFFSLNLSYDNAPLRSISSTLLGIASNIESSVHEWTSNFGFPTTINVLHANDLLEPPVTEQTDGIPYLQYHANINKDGILSTSEIPFNSSTTENEKDDEEKPRLLQMNIAANISACLSTFAFCVFTWFRKRIQNEQDKNSEYPINFECHEVSALPNSSQFYCTKEFVLLSYQETINLPHIGFIFLVNDPLLVVQEPELFEASERSSVEILYDESELLRLEKDDQVQEPREIDSVEIQKHSDVENDPEKDDNLLDVDKDCNTNQLEGLHSTNLPNENSSESNCVDPASFPLPPDAPSDWLALNQETSSNTESPIVQLQTHVSEISNGPLQIDCIILLNESTNIGSHKSHDVDPEETNNDHLLFSSYSGDTPVPKATSDDPDSKDGHEIPMMHAVPDDALVVQNKEDFQPLLSVTLSQSSEIPSGEEKPISNDLDQIEVAACTKNNDVLHPFSVTEKSDCERDKDSSEDERENIDINPKNSRHPVSIPTKPLSKPAALSKNNSNIVRPKTSFRIAPGSLEIPKRFVSQDHTANPQQRLAKGLISNKHNLSASSSAISQPDTSSKSISKEKRYPIFSNPSLLKTFVVPSSSPLPTKSSVSPPPSPQLTWDTRWGDGREIIHQSYTAELNQADMLPDESHTSDRHYRAPLRALIARSDERTGKQPMKFKKTYEAEKPKQDPFTKKSSVRSKDRMIHSGDKNTVSSSLKAKYKPNSSTSSSVSSRPSKSFSRSPTPVDTTMSTNLREGATTQNVYKENLECKSQIRSNGNMKDVLRELDEVPLPVLLERIHSRTQGVLATKTPAGQDFNIIRETGINQDKTKNFSPNLISSVPRDAVSSMREQAIASASINFADLAKDEAILAESSLIPLPLPSTFSIPTFNITCDESEGGSQPMTSSETVREQGTLNIREGAIELNDHLTHAFISIQKKTSSNPLFVFGKQDNYLPSDSRSASLSRALAEPFTLLDGLPSPDTSRKTDVSNSSSHLSNDTSHSSSIAQCTAKSAEDISHDVQSEKQLGAVKKPIDTCDQERLRSKKQPQNMSQRRHTYWEIVKEAELDKLRNQQISVLNSDACNSTSSGLQSRIDHTRAMNRGTPSLVSDVLTFEASNGSSSSTSSPWARSYSHTLTTPKIETSASYTEYPACSIEGLKVDRNMTRSLSPPTQDSTSSQRRYHPLLPSSPIWRHDEKSESSWTGPETVYNWPPTRSTTQMKSSYGYDSRFSANYPSLNSSLPVRQDVRRPITPPSPKPRSSWCMPGSKEDQEFWAEYEARQKRKAAVRVMSVSL